MKNYEWIFRRKKPEERIKSIADVDIQPGDFIVFSDDGPLITREIRNINSGGVDYAPLMWGETKLAPGGSVKLKDILEVFRKRSGPRETLAEKARKMKVETVSVPEPAEVETPVVETVPAVPEPETELPNPNLAIPIRTFGKVARPQ